MADVPEALRDAVREALDAALVEEGDVKACVEIGWNAALNAMAAWNLSQAAPLSARKKKPLAPPSAAERLRIYAEKFGLRDTLHMAKIVSGDALFVEFSPILRKQLRLMKVKPKH
jgi:hypothetical protein